VLPVQCASLPLSQSQAMWCVCCVKLLEPQEWLLWNLFKFFLISVCYDVTLIQSSCQVLLFTLQELPMSPCFIMYFLINECIMALDMYKLFCRYLCMCPLEPLIIEDMISMATVSLPARNIGCTQGSTSWMLKNMIDAAYNCTLKKKCFGTLYLCGILTYETSPCLVEE